MSNLGHEHDLGVWVGAIGLLTGWGTRSTALARIAAEKGGRIRNRRAPRYDRGVQSVSGSLS
jgi:hypothetical protein